MRKFLIAILVLVLILTGIFFWKGGHHALALSAAVSNWLETDSAVQSLHLAYKHQSFTVNEETGQVKQRSDQWELSADSFWTEHEDERIFGLSAEGISAYIGGQNLYLETGKAYALPELPEVKKSIERLTLGLLLYGRVTKEGDTYQVSMKTRELNLTATVTVDTTVQSITISADFPDGTAVNGTMTPKQSPPAPLPQPVADAISLSRTQPPMPLAEPLEVLLPAMEGLLPLSADLKLGISCGILELSETVQLTVSKSKAVLTREGKSMELSFPAHFSQLPPVALAALVLQEGEFTRTEDGALFTLTLSPETATGLLGNLVPQAAELGITLGESELSLSITAEELTSASISAEGSVPFLFTTIPVAFSAELTRP